MKNILIILIAMMAVHTLSAQPGRRDPSSRVQMEKDTVLSRIPNLSEDQQMIVVSLYTDYEASLKEIMSGDRSDREAFRAKMLAATQEKNTMMKEVLDDTQYEVFEAYLKEEREKRSQQRGERGEGRRGRGNQGNN
ncbi:MAG: hypothetical protein WBA74_01665 [Cyclobacteriaceae bacterium]